MRPRSEPSRTFVSIVASACIASCGTLAAPSTGDVDLPASLVGPFAALRGDQTPNGSTTLIRADVSGAQIDEPSIVRATRDARRVAYATFRTNAQPDTIGRASERMDRPAGSLSFDGAVVIFRAEQSWEGDFVRSPDVRVIDPTHYVMAYSARGGIGIATSSDGITFTHPNAPVIVADAMDASTDAPSEPSIARAPSGEWFMAFRRADSLFLARASDASGPWTIAPAPILTPSSGVPLDGASAFDAYGLADPALAIVTTAADRALFVVFYTATGPLPRTAIGAAASYDGMQWSRVPRAIYVDRANSVRAGSLDVVDPRTALLWVGSGTATNRGVSALIGPPVGRVTAPGM